MSTANAMSPLDPSEPSPAVDAHLDLRGTPCPINFVRTKLQLERMAAGARLEVWLDQGEPIEQVPDSLTMNGYHIEQLVHQDAFAVLIIRKPE